ncbi:MAG: DUF3841 domain-containing protein [Chloroflexota bacterium]
MKVWTIQTYPAWEQFQSTGVLLANVAFIEAYFLKAYHWLAQQMTLRLGPPPAGVDFPIWVWYRYDNADKPRPDLRHAGLLPRGTRGVLLECECVSHSVLLSDFLAWHYVLNNQYLPTDERDEQVFEDRWPAASAQDGDCQQQKIMSWQRIFNLEGSDAEEDYALPSQYKTIQGTLWELRLSQVKTAKTFIAR